MSALYPAILVSFTAELFLLTETAHVVRITMVIGGSQCRPRGGGGGGRGKMLLLTALMHLHKNETNLTGDHH